MLGVHNSVASRMSYGGTAPRTGARADRTLEELMSAADMTCRCGAEVTVPVASHPSGRWLAPGCGGRMAEPDPLAALGRDAMQSDLRSARTVRSR